MGSKRCGDDFYEVRLSSCRYMSWVNCVGDSIDKVGWKFTPSQGLLTWVIENLASINHWLFAWPSYHHRMGGMSWSFSHSPCMAYVHISQPQGWSCLATLPLHYIMPRVFISALTHILCMSFGNCRTVPSLGIIKLMGLPAPLLWSI